MITCSVCGSQNEAEAKFCGTCGNKLEAASGANATAEANADEATPHAPAPKPPAAPPVAPPGPVSAAGATRRRAA